MLLVRNLYTHKKNKDTKVRRGRGRGDGKTKKLHIKFLLINKLMTHAKFLKLNGLEIPSFHIKH